MVDRGGKREGREKIEKKERRKREEREKEGREKREEMPDQTCPTCRSYEDIAVIAYVATTCVICMLDINVVGVMGCGHYLCLKCCSILGIYVTKQGEEKPRRPPWKLERKEIDGEMKIKGLKGRYVYLYGAAGQLAIRTEAIQRRDWMERNREAFLRENRAESLSPRSLIPSLRQEERRTSSSGQAARFPSPTPTRSSSQHTPQSPYIPNMYSMRRSSSSSSTSFCSERIVPSVRRTRSLNDIECETQDIFGTEDSPDINREYWMWPRTYAEAFNAGVEQRIADSLKDREFRELQTPLTRQRRSKLQNVVGSTTESSIDVGIGKHKCVGGCGKNVENHGDICQMCDEDADAGLYRSSTDEDDEDMKNYYMQINNITGLLEKAKI